MGLSFFKRLNILPWLCINLGSGGISLSGGPKGLKVTRKVIGKNPGSTRVTASKFGLRYTQQLGKKKK